MALKKHDDQRPHLGESDAQLLDSIFTHSPLEVFILSETFHILRTTQYLAHQMCGVSPEEISGKHLSEVVGPKAWSFLEPFFQATQHNSYAQDIHFVLEETSQLAKKQQYTMTLFPLPKKDGSRLIGGTFIDFTKEISIEQKLITNQHRLEMAQRAGGIGLFEWDLQSNHVWPSTEEIALFELSSFGDQPVIDQWLDRIHPEDKDTILKTIQTSSQTDEVYDTEYRILLPENTLKWIRGKGRFYRDENGKPSHLVGVNFDITAQKKKELFLQFKAESSRALVSTMDIEDALQQMCQIATHYVADWCGVDLLKDRNLSQIAFAHNKVSNHSITKKYVEKYKTTLGLEKVLRHVINDKSPLIVPSMERLVSDEGTPNHELKYLEEALQISSAMIIPLIVHEEAIGTISFFLKKSHSEYTDTDLELAQQLALRVSLFVENRILHDQAEQEQKRLTELLDTVPAIVFESVGSPGEKYEISFINSYAEELLGYPLQNWTTIPHFGQSIMHPEDLPRVIEESKGTVTSGVQGSTKYRYKKKNGDYIWVESRFIPILDDNGNVNGFRGVVQDISKRMELEERKDVFIAAASHELKTPLTSLKVFTQVLKSLADFQTNTKAQKYLDRMEKEVDRLTDLVFDLLDLSKIQRGSLVLKQANMSVTVLLHEIVQNLQPTITQFILFAEDTDVQLIADEQRLTQVFTNLISNAAKYSPTSSTIHLTIKIRKDTVLIEVRDEGIGIASEFQDQIFERFYRVLDGKDKSYPGLGMGLFISKTIVQSHQGKIWVKSKVGKGSSFFVQLPLHPTPEGES